MNRHQWVDSTCVLCGTDVNDWDADYYCPFESVEEAQKANRAHDDDEEVFALPRYVDHENGGPLCSEECSQINIHPND